MRPSSIAILLSGAFLLMQILLPTFPEYQWGTYFFVGVGLICTAIETLTKTLTQTRK